MNRLFTNPILACSLILAACGQPPEPRAPGPLKAAAAAVVVTPPVETYTDLNGNEKYDAGEPFADLDGDGLFDPIWVAGFGNDRGALGVHDDLYARVLVVERDDQRLAIISADWVGVLYDDALWLRRMADEAGLELDQLILSSTHNHEGPDTLGIWGESIFVTGRDPAYMERSFAAIVGAIGQAVADLTPCRIIAGVGHTEGLTHDSRLPEVKDEQLLALRFEATEDGRPLALIAHWSNHPEALGGSNRWLTADFPASLVATLEASAPGAVGIYWQGMVGGLLNPLHVHLTDELGQPIADSSFEKAARLGQLVGQQALDLLAAGEDATDDGYLAYRHRAFLLPADNEEMILASQIGLFGRTLYDAAGREVSPGSVEQHFVETEVTVVDLGLVQLATVPGELYPELGLVDADGAARYQDPQDPGADFQGAPCAPPIQAGMRDTPYRIILGLANDELGYLIPKCQYDRQAPFAYGHDSAQYGEGFCPSPDAAPTINRILAEELAALQAGWSKAHPAASP